jgi:four helix bundle protein
VSRARRVAAAATLDTGLLSDWEEGMNNPEVTMHGPQPTSNFITLSKAVEAAAIAIAAVLKVPAPLKSLADQVVRSASSVPANLAEGAGRAGKDRAYHWRVAYGSAKEVDTHLRLLIGIGAVNPRQTESVLALFDEVRAMTWRLLNH